MRYRITRKGCPLSGMELDAESKELAWDKYKEKGGKRYRVGEEPPVIEEIAAEESVSKKRNGK